MEIIHLDEEKMILKSHEYGDAVKKWNHTLTVKKSHNSAILIDRIEIDAGKQTKLYIWWAKFMYGRRHKPRQKMLGLN